MLAAKYFINSVLPDPVSPLTIIFACPSTHFKRKSKTANTIINNINLITKDMDISLPYKYLINNIDSDEYHELIDNLDNYLKKLKI